MKRPGSARCGYQWGWAGNPDLLTTLAAAAERTSHLIFGIAIIQVFSRHPVLLATQALSLHSLAPNRLRLGVGVGTTELARSIYGVEMESQLSYLREYLQVLVPLLQQGDCDLTEFLALQRQISWHQSNLRALEKPETSKSLLPH